MARLALSLLGPLQVRLDDQPLSGLAYDKVRALLAYLAVEARPHGRDALAELLWPEQEGAAARRSLRVALSTLRQALGEATASIPFLIATRESVQVNRASDIALDLTAFTELLHQCARHAHRDGAVCPACATRMSEAVALYRGEFLQHLAVRDSAAFDEWVTLTRERLHHSALGALAQLAAYHEAQGEDEQARQYAWRTLTLESWDESAHRCVMRVLARKGQRAAALAQYERCREVLAEELGVEPSDETTALYEQIRDNKLRMKHEAVRGKPTREEQFSIQPHNLPTPLTPLIDREQDIARLHAPTTLEISPTIASADGVSREPAHNLPLQLTSFVGRSRELAMAAQRFADARLVMLTGPGGIGKTRLALRVAQRLLAQFPAGAWLVELAPLADPTLIVPTIATILGLREEPGQPLLATLTSHLRNKQLLIVLDNCEHLIDACAHLADDLLHAAPQLRILATSREPLDVAGEAIVSVPALAVPDPQQIPPLEALAQVEAIQLFVERARAVEPAFQITPARAAPLIQICRRLDGMALAIELAAARVRMLTIEQITQHLEDNFHLLTSSSRTALPRHQTLTASIDWSYTLLTDVERALLRRLAVFVGGWTLEAAEAIAGDKVQDETLELLTHLVDKSLVQVDRSGAEARYRMLETIREYALERLVASGEEAALRQRHAQYYLALVERAEPLLHGAEQVAWLHRLEVERDNLHGVLAWSQAADGAAVGLRIVAALWLFWQFGGRLSEGREQVTRLLALPEAATPTVARARALFTAGFLIGAQGDFALAHTRLTESEMLSRTLGYPQGVAFARIGLGFVAWLQCEYTTARALHTESLMLSRELGERWPIALSLIFLGQDELYLDAWERAVRLLEEGLLLFRELGDQFFYGHALLSLGYAARLQGDNMRAAASYAECLTLFRDLRHMWGIAAVQLAFGYLAQAQGDVPRAATYFAESLVRYRELGHLEGISLCLAGSAGVAASLGQPVCAAELFGAAEALRAIIGIGSSEAPIERAAYQESVAGVRAQLDQESFAAAWAAGRALSLDQAIAEALATGAAEPHHAPPISLPTPPASLASHPILVERTLLVGRIQEWAQLQAAWRAVAGGRPQLVLLAGEAGIGKTRLAEELTTWVGRQGIATATARCYAAEGAPAYAPVTAWLRSDALRPALSQLDTIWLTEVARMVPELLVQRPDLPRPSPLTEPWQHQHLRDALARAVLGSRQPLLLLIDDLQWCDLETLEWLHYLLRFDPQAPLLLAATVRSEELAVEHPLTTWLAAVRRAGYATEIELSPLGQAETAELVAQVTGATPDPTVAMHVYAETEGNPLFVVETARAGIAPGPHPLPTTMKDVIATRLAQLAPPARDLVHVAATIGRSFTVEVLAHATDSDEDALVRGLDELWQRRIVREHGDTTYDFSHDKIREVAYGEMSAARRRLLHRRVAAALEAVYTQDLDAVSGQIAAHYERAGQAGHAVAYYRRAAEVARQVYANADAIDYYRRALTLLDVRTGGKEAAEVLERLGDLLELTGQHDEAGETYRRALDGAEHCAIARARLLRKQGVVWTTQRRYSEAQQACEAAEATLGPEPGEEDLAWWQEWIQIQTDQMMLHYWQAHVDQIGMLVEKTRPIAERYGTPAQRAGFFRSLSWFHLRRDRYVISPETLSYAQRCLEAQQQAGGLSELGNAHFALGFAWLWYEDLDAAEQEMLAALDLAERSGDVTTQSRCLTYLTIVERKRGRIDAVREYVRRSLAVATAGQMLEYLGAAKGNLAWLAWRAGDLAEVRARGQEALELWGQLTIVYPFHWTALWSLIGATLAQDQLVETIDHVRHLLEPTQQRMPDALEAILQEALDEWEQGRPEQAREYLLRAVEPAKRLGFL